MPECDCRSLSPFILLLFIPIMLIVDHHDENSAPQAQTSPPPKIDTSKTMNDGISYIKSWGYVGFMTFTMIILAIVYKTWRYNKPWSIMALLMIPTYWWFFVSGVPLSASEMSHIPILKGNYTR